MSAINLSLIIPCYNEAKNLPALVERLTEVLKRDDLEVILVDNGSTDESAVLLQKLTSGHALIRVVNVPVNQGYGFGILTGLRVSKGQYIGWTHADLQTDPVDALRALEIILSKDQKNLFIKGRRYGRPLGDVIFAVGMSIFETLVLGTRLWDINAQPTIFPREFFINWQNPPHDFSLDLYAYYQARRNKLLVKRIAVLFGSRLHGSSHWNISWASKYKFILRTIEFTFKLRKSLFENRKVA